MTTTPFADAVLARVVDLRSELQSLAKELPAVARVLPAAELVGTVEVVQECSNLLGACDAAVVAEVDRQGVHETFGATSTAALLAWRLRVRPAEAKRRVTVARACAERVGFSGEVMPPLREHVAAGQLAGDLSADHAVVIARVMDRLPVHVPVDELSAVEAALVEYARSADPTEVATCGREVIDRYDPDGPEPRDEAQRRRRSLRLWQRDNGMGAIRGDLPADLYAKLQTVLSALAAPQTDRDSCADDADIANGVLDPDADTDANGRDTRTPAMRLCDALEEVVDRILRSGTLPDTGGVPATVAVTIPLAELEARTGQVHTGHGGTMSTGQLLHLACEAEIIPVVLDNAGGIISYGRTKRLATADQTKALRARDGGCTFPGCRRPPEWCQRHHVKEWLRDDGPTDLDNLTLLCARHHHDFESWGWSVTMTDGVAWWTPPAHLDPEQKPIRNHAHHRPVLFAAA